MTLRQSKHLVMIAVGLIVLLEAVHLGLFIWRPGPQRDLGDIILPMMVLVMLWSVWARLSRLEAEHGPDYVQPRSGFVRPLIIGLAMLAAILGGVAAYLIATHR